jgi:hypothetical protein
VIVDQINNSPFVTKEFLDLVIQLNSSSDSDLQHDLFSIKDGTLYNSGSRDYIDYRPNFNLTSKSLKDLNCKKVSLDSMHFDQIKEIYKITPRELNKNIKTRSSCKSYAPGILREVSCRSTKEKKA